jgi:hypothetical protein
VREGGVDVAEPAVDPHPTGLPQEQFGLPLGHHVPVHQAELLLGFVLGGAQRRPARRLPSPNITPRKR